MGSSLANNKQRFLEAQLIYLIFTLFGIVWFGALLTPSALLECYMCDSVEDVECAIKPGQQIEVEECPNNNNDECVTVVSAGTTRRGCLSRLYPNKYCPAPCDRCNTSLCNRYIFPANRLRCYQCSGSECIDVHTQPELILPCPIYHENDRCFTNIIHMSNTLRGCEHTNLPATCPHVCLKCNYNGCNNELTVYESKCLQCSHFRNSPNPVCLRNQADRSYSNNPLTTAVALAMPTSNSQCALGKGTVTECTNKVMHGHREKCFTYINAQTEVIQRGCSTTMGFYPTGEVTECTGTDCNNNCFDIACKSCNATSEYGYQCRNGINLDAQKCAKGTVGCYSCERDTELRRGCVDPQFQQRPGEACQLCRSADGCNRWPVRTCYRCNSLESNLCADWSNETLIERANCTYATEPCVTTVVQRIDYVYTIRGCASEVPECTKNDPYCVRCNGSLCNYWRTSWPERTTTDLMIKTDETDADDDNQIDFIASWSSTFTRFWTKYF